MLKAARLVTDRAEGTRRLYAVDPRGIEAVREWLDGFWDETLAAFKAAAEGRGDRDRGNHDDRASFSQRVRSEQRAKVLSVKAPPDVAWRVFTEKMGTWWPLGEYKIGKAKAVDAIVEPRVGGRWYELGEDGSSVTGAPCWRGSRRRDWCFPGTSLPTGSTTRT